MNRFLFSILLGMSLIGVSVTSFAESSPIYAECTPHESCWVNEVGLLVPTNSSGIRDYFAANSITPTPLTGGLSSGLQFGRHYRIGNAATIGATLSGNVLYSSGATTTQVYQTAAYFVARGYLSQTWRSGIFAEIGIGPEVSAVSVANSDFMIQANASTRLGVGYNYQFNDDVSVGVSVGVTPSITSDNYLDGARVLVNMLW